MDSDQFDSIWILIFCASLVICFGLGAIHGAQR